MTVSINKANMMETRNRFNPFYAPPSSIYKTSAEIISEARAAMQSKLNYSSNRSPQAIRLVHTKRPFTPRESNRTLFGRNNVGRPPSAISLNQVQFHDLELNLPRLNETPNNRLNGFFTQENTTLGRSGRMRLPAINDTRKKKHFRGTSSLDNLPEEIEAEPAADIQTGLPLRTIHSSPKERTNLEDELETDESSPFKNKQIKAIALLKTNRDGLGLKPIVIDKKINKSNPHQAKNELFRKEQYSPLKSKSFDVEKFGSGQVINEETTGEQEENLTKENSDVKSKIGDKFIDKSNKKDAVMSFNGENGQNLDEKLMFSNKKIPVMNKMSEVDMVTQENQINEARAVAHDLEKQLKVETTEIVLEQLHKVHKEAEKEACVIGLFEKLYNCLESEHITSSKNNKLKSRVLKTVYKFVENASEMLLLQIARIALLLRVSGHNLSAVCKLIFKVSRHDKNDKLFLSINILELFVESLGRASPLEDSEACIYGYGALKFLTMNNQLLQSALQLGILELMVLHIKIVNNARMEPIMIPEPTKHALFQLTGALRNVASEEATFPKFVTTGTVTELCRAMELFSADLDLISNISRTLSIISTNELCCQCIVNYGTSFQTFTKLLGKFPGRQDIVVRLGYALGNIMAKCHHARLKLYEEAGAVSAILTLLESYMEKDLEMMKHPNYPGPDYQVNSPELGSDGSVEDVIIKMIRIIANMSMHPDAGIGLTCFIEDDEETYSPLRQHSVDGSRFMNILLMVLRRKSASENEELVLSTLSTLNNLSYYAEPESTRDGPFAQHQLEIAQALSTLMMTANEECLVEITRVFGNLTRNKETRDYMLETGGICQLVRCLEKENRDLLCTTTGVLVNMMADWDKRLAFKEDNGVAKLISILERYGESDWKLANLICQALWNFCIDSTHLYAALGIQATNRLLSVLVDFLDEERLFAIPDGEDVDESTASSHEYQQWELFAGVATNLLEKIEQYLETLEAFRGHV